MTRVLRVAVLSSVLALVHLQLSAQSDALRAAYVKQEIEIPMRDGIHLFAVIVVPRGTSTPLPILMP